MHRCLVASATVATHLHGTVLVPTYRRPAHLRRCLAGIRQQCRPADDVIIVVQGDDQPSFDIMAEHPWARSVHVQEPGVIAALNAGLAALDPAGADGFVAMCDDDAIPRRDWLASIEQRFLSDPRIGGIGGPDFQMHAADSSPVSVGRVGRFRWFGRMEGNEHRGLALQEVHFLKGVNQSYRRVAVASRRVDPSLRGNPPFAHNDLELSLAVAAAGWRLVHDPAVQVDHDLGPGVDRVLVTRSLERIHDAGYNKLLIVRRHLGLLRALSIMPWELACGDGFSPGPWRLYRMGAPIRRFLPMMAAATTGKLRGLVAPDRHAPPPCPSPPP